MALLQGHQAAVTAVAVTPDGSKIVTGSQDSTVRVWNANTGSELTQLQGFQTVVTALAVTRDGTQVITGSSDWTARIWDMQTGTELRQLKGHGGGIRSVAVTADGARIITGSDDATARIWDANTGAELAQLKGHQGAVTAVTVMADGARIVTGSDDSTARIWDANTGTELAQLKGPKGAVTAVTVTPDGTRVVTGSRDGTVQMWEMLPSGQALIQDSKVVVRRCLSPAQRTLYYLPDTPPRWCGVMEKWPYGVAFSLGEGRRLLSENKQVEAELLFAEALKRDPSVGKRIDSVRAEVSFEHGLTMLRMGKDEDAGLNFAEALKRDPLAGKRIDKVWVETYIERGRKLLNEGRDDDATAVFREALRLDPLVSKHIDDIWVETYIESGRTLVRSDDGAAERLFAEALKRNPSVQKRIDEIWSSWVESYLDDSLEFLDEGKDEQANRIFSLVLKRDPSAAGRIASILSLTYVYRGREFLDEGNGEAAELMFAEALKHDASNDILNEITRVYIGRGRKFLDEGTGEAAELMFAEALKRDASNDILDKIARVYIERGGDLLAKGKHDEAEVMFTQALQRDSSAGKSVLEASAKAYNAIAWNLFLTFPKDKSAEALIQAEKALEYAEKSIALAPENATFIDTRGSIYLWLERLDEAFADLDKAIRLNIQHPRSYFGRGRCYELKGEQALAIRDYRKALGLTVFGDYSRSVQLEAKQRLVVLLRTARVQGAPSSRAPALTGRVEPQARVQLAMNAVETAQRALHNIGYTDIGPADGIATPRTIWAITLFRRKTGMPPGSIDEALLQRLALAEVQGDTLPAPALDQRLPAPGGSVEDPSRVQAASRRIQAVQRALLALGSTDIGAADGIAGPRTRAAIERFRQENDMPPGFIDEALLRRLGLEVQGDAPPAPSPGLRLPAPGGSVEDPSRVQAAISRIQAVQRALLALGYTKVGPADGIASSRTSAAIERFRQKNGMPPGLIDEALLRRLGLSE